ncbi:uncharacterized oxidoreductase -like isoform X2 [Pelobates cultripes]|uniref:Uncharacterized oxidoreductase -like isoform X2 n=1 Tax=Pelobates cultripes TaxID=61616 RepID=A0AAD1SU04_PELCU|nr:uncharacterized oxidoreductase -like isoform X2 [Pelobates cultripes]
MDKAKFPTVTLASGQHIPILGLGMSHHGGYSHNALLYALRNCGIRHIDTAKRYGNEAFVGKAIAESGVNREELWITTKLWPGDYGYQNTIQACLDSCERLGLEYLDLYLMHWPDAHVPGKTAREIRAETWQAMEDLYRRAHRYHALLICLWAEVASRSSVVRHFRPIHCDQLRLLNDVNKKREKT